MNLDNFKVQEMITVEMKNTDGGFLVFLLGTAAVIGGIWLGMKVGDWICGCVD